MKCTSYLMFLIPMRQDIYFNRYNFFFQHMNLKSSYNHFLALAILYLYIYKYSYGVNFQTFKHLGFSFQFILEIINICGQSLEVIRSNFKAAKYKQLLIYHLKKKKKCRLLSWKFIVVLYIIENYKRLFRSLECMYVFISILHSFIHSTMKKKLLRCKFVTKLYVIFFQLIIFK